MKSALVLTLLAAVALGWGSNSDEFQLDKIDEYFFKFLEGMNVHISYENSQICKDATYDIKNQLLYDATIIVDRNGKLLREGVCALAKTTSVFPDFLRHCDGTVSFMFTQLIQHFKQFKTFQEFQKSFVDNFIYQIFLLKNLFAEMQTLASQNKIGDEFFLILGQMLYKTFNFNKSENLLLSPSEPRLEERLLQTSDQDQFTSIMTFTLEALRTMNILQKDEDLQQCANSFLSIDEQVTIGNEIYMDGNEKEGFFSMLDALKHLGTLCDSCGATYDEFVDDSVDYFSRVPSSTQLLLNTVGNFPDIMRSFSRLQLAFDQNKPEEAGVHFGTALSYLFINFDIYQDFEDLP